MRVLYVEDEKFLAEAVKHNLEKQEIKTDIAFDGEEGLNMAVASIYDCIILDIMLPKLSGLEILERIREKGINTPVIMLSALSEVEDKVRGLNMGADDYLAKPFKTAELVARIMALTRRPQDLQQETISFLDLTYNTDEKSLNGEKMTGKEADILIEKIEEKDGKTIAEGYTANYIRTFAECGGRKFSRGDIAIGVITGSDKETCLMKFAK